MKFKSVWPVGVVLVGAAIWSFPADVAAQNVNVTTPFVTNRDSYFENFGVNFGFSFGGGGGSGSRVSGLLPNGRLIPNPTFFQGGSLGAQPVFGGYSPNAGARFGFGRRNPDGSGFSLGIHLAKGSNRQSFTTAPSLTVQNGFGGSLFHGSVRPFVSGYVPVVGNGPPPIDNAVTRAIRSGQLDLNYQPEESSAATSTSAPVTYSNANSTANHGDRSVEAIKAERERRIAIEAQALKEILDEAQRLVDQNELSLARTKFREALRLTENERLRNEIKGRIASTRK